MSWADEKANLIVKAIRTDMDDRRGMRSDQLGIDRDVWRAIEKEWARLIAEILSGEPLERGDD